MTSPAAGFAPDEDTAAFGITGGIILAAGASGIFDLVKYVSSTFWKGTFGLG